MSATEMERVWREVDSLKRENESRWQLALDGLKESSTQYQTLTRIVQNGFGTIGEQLSRNSARISTLESEVKAVRAAETDCQQQLAALQIDGRARATLQKLLVGLCVALLLFTLAQTALWWYVVTKLFHV